MTTTTSTDARPLGELFSDLTRDLTTLVRNELSLARAEMSGKISRATKHLGMIAIGAVVALAGLFTLAACLVLVLVQVGVSAWLAALLVGLALAAIGGMMAMSSLSALKKEDLTPTATLESLKETTWKRQTN